MYSVYSVIFLGKAFTFHSTYSTLHLHAAPVKTPSPRSVTSLLCMTCATFSPPQYIKASQQQCCKRTANLTGPRLHLLIIPNDLIIIISQSIIVPASTQGLKAKILQLSCRWWTLMFLGRPPSCLYDVYKSFFVVSTQDRTYSLVIHLVQNISTSTSSCTSTIQKLWVILSGTVRVSDPYIRADHTYTTYHGWQDVKQQTSLSDKRGFKSFISHWNMLMGCLSKMRRAIKSWKEQSVLHEGNSDGQWARLVKCISLTSLLSLFIVLLMKYQRKYVM